MNEDGIAQLRRRSARVAAVRRYSSMHNLKNSGNTDQHRSSAYGPAALPLAQQLSTLHGTLSETLPLPRRSTCALLVDLVTDLKLSARHTCAASYGVYKRHDARSTKSRWRRALLFMLDEPRSSAPASVLYAVLMLTRSRGHRSRTPQTRRVSCNRGGISSGRHGDHDFIVCITHSSSPD